MMSESHFQTVNQLPAIHKRERDGNKGTFGKVLLITGSRGMSGAAVLSGLGALRGGAGLVYVAVPAGIQDIVASAESSYLTIRLSEDENGRIDINQIHRNELITPFLKLGFAIAIGPGCGQSESLKNLVKWIYEVSEAPVVLDADALNLLSQLDQLPEDMKGPRILTPHPGEFSRLTNLSIKEIQANREKHAVEYAKKNRITLLLKGANTIITNGDKLAVNPTGNPGMATGGSGDVLTGLLAALLAQGYSPFDAAQLGAYLHGLAGDLAAIEFSQNGMIASDIPKCLSKAWKKIR